MESKADNSMVGGELEAVEESGSEPQIVVLPEDTPEMARERYGINQTVGTRNRKKKSISDKYGNPDMKPKSNFKLSDFEEG